MAQTLTLPLRLGPNGSLATAEQNSVEDIESCVRVILSYPVGWRDDSPSFGRPPVTFKKDGVDIETLTQDILLLESRATPEIVASVIADGVETLTVNVGV